MDCLQELPKDLQKHIFKYAGPPTSPVAALVKGEAFQKLQRKIRREWCETWQDYRHVQEGEAVFYYPEWLWNLSATENITDYMVMEATYEAMSCNIEERTLLRRRTFKQ